MKVRNGFVSNSSSSSFVIAKAYMTEDQITEFKEFIRENNDDDSEFYIRESKYYFSGSGEMYDGEKYENKIFNMGLNPMTIKECS